MNVINALNSLERRKLLFFLLLFLSTLLFRLPTLFNDFYDVDELAAIVQTHEYLAGDVPGRDFQESKLPLYHAIFKISYRLSPDRGWVIVHAITILIVFATSVFVYIAGRLVSGFPAGALASVLYSALISSFNRHFMATNGEIVFNLPVAAAFCFFLVFLRSAGARRIATAVACAACGAAAVFVKFHGLIFFIFAAVYIFLYRPYFAGRFSRRYAAALSAGTALITAGAAADYALTGFFTPGAITAVRAMITYIVVQGTDPLVFLGKYVHHQALFALWHMVLWVPAAVYALRFVRNRLRAGSEEESAAAVMFLLSYLMVFAGGSRLYYHYFMISYPFLCIVASRAIMDCSSRAAEFVRTRLAVLMLVPALFFLAWNTKDAVIRNACPDAFYKEGRVLYWARAVLVGTFNDYLLPEASYREACEYTAKITKPGDRVFAWADGPYFYYFPKRRPGVWHMWPKTSVKMAVALYEKGDAESIREAEAIENGLLDSVRKKRPVLFIDISENGLNGFIYRPTPLVKKYVDEHYRYIHAVNRIKFYVLREGKR